MRAYEGINGYSYVSTGTDDWGYYGRKYDMLDRIEEKRKTKDALKDKLRYIKDTIKVVKHNKEKIFVEKAPGYELLRGE